MAFNVRVSTSSRSLHIFGPEIAEASVDAVEHAAELLQGRATRKARPTCEGAAAARADAEPRAAAARGAGREARLRHGGQRAARRGG